MVQEVQALNKRIEAINVQKTKAEAKAEMLKKQLVAAIGSYKATYGVDLSDKSFAKLSGKVKAELNKVSSTLQEEYELKEKVVSAIEEGRYDDAYALLGIEREVEEVQEEETLAEGTEVTSERVLDDVTEGATEGGTGESINGGAIDFDVPAVEDTEDDFDFGDIEVETEEEVKVSDTKKSSGVKGESVAEAVESMDLTVEDDDIPDVDTDFGFGDMLSGTQFEV